MTPRTWRRPSAQLRGDLLDHHRLPRRILAAVAVAAVDHELRREVRGLELGGGTGDVVRAVVGRVVRASQDDVAVGVSARRDDGRDPLLGDRQEMVRVHRRADCVDRDAHVAVGAVLEADRHREPGCQLAMDLALGRARADRAPRDEIGGELRRDRVEELGAGRHAELGEIEQELSRDAEPLVDREAAVELGIVDEPLPPDGGARLLEVHAHEDHEIVLEAARGLAELRAVFEGCLRIVDRTGPDDREQPIVVAAEARARAGARARDRLRRASGDRQLLDEDGGRDQRAEACDAKIVGRVEHAGGPGRPASAIGRAHRSPPAAARSNGR